MNSAFVNPGSYSCAVDAFLEISTHLFLPYLSSLRIRNEFTDLFVHIIRLPREHSSLLREIREPVWSYMIGLCCSFAARDCNACFSQIFEKRTFGYLNEEEGNLFMTLRTFDSLCSSCSNFLTLNSSIILTVVTDDYIAYKYIVASLVIVVKRSVDLFFFFENITDLITYNILLLHRISIQYHMIVIYFILKFTDKYVDYLHGC